MSQSFEELRPNRDYLKRAAEQQRVFQLKQLQSEALRVSNLIADPNWEIVCRYAEQLQREYETRAEREKEKLLGELSYDQYRLAKQSYESHRQFALGIRTTLTIAKTIVERGEKALDELKLLNVEGV